MTWAAGYLYLQASTIPRYTLPIGVAQVSHVEILFKESCHQMFIHSKKSSQLTPLPIVVSVSFPKQVSNRKWVQALGLEMISLTIGVFSSFKKKSSFTLYQQHPGSQHRDISPGSGPGDRISQSEGSVSLNDQSEAGTTFFLTTLAWACLIYPPN